MTDEPEDPNAPDDPEPEQPDPNLITTHSFGREESPTEDRDEPSEP